MSAALCLENCHAEVIVKLFSKAPAISIVGYAKRARNQNRIAEGDLHSEREIPEHHFLDAPILSLKESLERVR